ncbi:hypothetical protein ABR738_05515 [Streptomyces sp. Edi4]|uniref:hypothetical protein n=1 Tax=Streptomyces sp. Edi4 TaxID=3162527 RepID=UPI00330614D5
MRRCATAAAIVLCGALATGTAAPAHAAPRPPAVQAPSEVPGALDPKAGDDSVRTWLARVLGDIDELVAREKKDAAADVAEAKAEATEAKADAARMAKEFSALGKDAPGQSRPVTAPASAPAPAPVFLAVLKPMPRIG